jgi:hypothetical protein
MITLKPLTYNKTKFIKDLVRETIFMTKHNPDDNLEIVMNIFTYSYVRDSDFVDIDPSKAFADGDYNASSMFDIPIRIDNTIPSARADVVLKK